MAIVEKLPNKQCTTTWLTSISLSEDQRWDFPAAAAAAAAAAAGRKAAWLMADEATSDNEPPGTYNDKIGRLLKRSFRKWRTLERKTQPQVETQLQDLPPTLKSYGYFYLLYLDPSL